MWIAKSHKLLVRLMVLIPILTPATESKNDYYSRKKRHTINTQAVVGANLMFLHVTTGFPGCMLDARVLQHTPFFAWLDKARFYLNHAIKLITSQLSLYCWRRGPTLFQHGWRSRMRTLQIWPALKKDSTKNFHLQECLWKELSAFLKLVGDAF